MKQCINMPNQGVTYLWDSVSILQDRGNQIFKPAYPILHLAVGYIII